MSAADDQLGDCVRKLELARQSPRFLHYFAAPPSPVIPLGLEDEMGGWAGSLASEPEPVLEQRRKVAIPRTDHCVRDITSLVDDIKPAAFLLRSDPWALIVSCYGSVDVLAADGTRRAVTNARALHLQPLSICAVCVPDTRSQADHAECHSRILLSLRSTHCLA